MYLRMAWDRKVPIHRITNTMLAYVDWRVRTDVEWVPAEAFDAQLEYQDYARGRSAAYFWFRDTATGRRYPVRMAGMHGIIPHLRDGYVSGRWRPVKNGANYAVRLLEVTP